ncbi:enoyl-CoA hydratase/isomerase family protein [Leptospira interrogans]
MSDAVLHEIVNAVAYVTINRPEVRNAIDTATCQVLEDTLTTCAKDPTVRVIVIRGAGDRSFVSGADVREFRDKLGTVDGAIAYDEAVERMQQVIRTAPQPVIAAIQGHAIGNGCVLAVACDFRIASQRAKFGIPIAKFGFFLGPPDTVRLAELIGEAQARRLLMTGDVIDAETARGIGLVDDVHEADALHSAVTQFAEKLAANAPLSIKATKQILARFVSRSPTIADGTAWYREIYASEDLKEGINAFFDKRTPGFSGK